MEEILASIRRIISEDGSLAQDAGRGPERAEPAPSEQATPAAAGGTEDEALLLTEMVTDDGTVVSLSDRQQQTRAAGPAPQERASEPSPIRPAPEPPLPEPPAPERAAPAPVADEVPEPAPEVGVVEPEPQAAAEPEPMMDQSEQPDRPAITSTSESLSKEPTRLVSEATFAASTAALSQLSRAVRKDKEISIGGGRMVEDLVREALEPMLREWLDANLQGIVERLVRQEIERMVRRAEEE